MHHLMGLVPPDQSALAIHCHGSLRCGTRGALRARNYRAWSIRPDFHAALQQDIAAACLARQAETGPYPPTPFGFWESDLGGDSWAIGISMFDASGSCPRNSR